MKTEHALRHLLLRHMETFEARVGRPLFLGVTRSLQVEPEGRGFVVTWKAGGEAHRESFAPDSFRFYQRGDTRPEGRSVDDALDNQNDARARAFAEKVFGVTAPDPQDRGAEPLEPHRFWALLEAGALALLLLAVGGLAPAPALILLALVLVEHAKAGRVYGAALLLPLAWLGPPAAALAGALAYAALQALDPDPTRRRLRVALCLGAAGVAGAGLADAELRLGLGALGLGGVAAAIAFARSLHGAHRRALPLALPFYCWGLHPDGQPAAAAIGLAFLVLTTLVAAFGHRWARVQQARPSEAPDRGRRAVG